jgi:hypothetical protein
MEWLNESIEELHSGALENRSVVDYFHAAWRIFVAVVSPAATRGQGERNLFTQNSLGRGKAL